MDQSYDAVFLDDDELIVKMWQLSARKAGIRLLAVSSAEEFRAAWPLLSRETPLYIDSELKGQERGERLAEEAFDAGFRRIYLATGMPAEAFGKCPFLTGILSKDPPW